MKERVVTGNRGRGTSPAEESPDCIERGVLSIRKDAADYMPRKDQCNREQTAVFRDGKGERVG